MAEFLPFDGEEGDEMDQKVHFIHALAALPKLLQGLDIAAASVQLGAGLVLEGVADSLSNVILGKEIV